MNKMEWKRRTYIEGTVEAQISSFTGEGETTEYHVLLSVTNNHLSFAEQFQALQQAYSRCLGSELNAGAVAVFRRYFLSDVANQADWVTVWECEQTQCALSLLQQAPLNGTKVSLWAWLVTNTSITTEMNGMVLARRGEYTHMWTAGAYNKASNAEYQTRLLLNDYVMQLMAKGCTLAKDCIRTWFFVQNVDVNYAGVVKARKEVFLTQNLTEETHYIASTGIEGRSADPSVLVTMDTYAIQGLLPDQIQFLYAPSHLNPTYEYGVTFERGTAVTYGDRKQIFISGTASIDNRGEIVAPGDIINQAKRMMENVEVLLAEAGATWKDVMQAIVYLRDPADYQVVSDFLTEEYPGLPCLLVHAPVCRPGWLCETECIAVIPVSNEIYAPF